MHAKYLPLLGILALLPHTTLATDPDDDWLNDDSEFRALAVNDGELKFIDEPKGKPVHHHHNRIELFDTSLDDGWVGLVQCHENLDAVRRAQVVYNEHRSRGLEVTSFENIGRAWVEGATVQLEDVGQRARLCVRAETLALEANEDGSYSLRNGPFMRRFLDGYYPMRVSMDIRVPEQYLRFAGTQPPRQDGFDVWSTPEGVQINAWFEGRLHTEVRFQPDFCDNPGPTTC
ncbi:MAG TPA: alpha/beta hydrolase [Thioalkalivibrio sp.]|nr:alpha/beta hydrolase [Thioalkalivibrio sp.]